MSTNPSNAGGVAARVGFKYQDHVAAGQALQMIEDAHFVRIECETSDDITVVRMTDSIPAVEYIQVKTTGGDKKWSLTEITFRKDKKSGTSLVEKSLACDRRTETATFRIVSSRDVYSNLSKLKIPVEERSVAIQAEIDKIGKSLFSKFKKVISPNGNNFYYWARNAVWDVQESIESIRTKNTLKVLQLAGSHGDSPAHSHAQSIYLDLLRLVADAAEACSIRASHKKQISRAEIIQWWTAHMAQSQTASLQSAKPYKGETPEFFSEIHRIDEPAILRHLNGYDAGFERQKWRTEQLADYLVDWLPEIALKASELIGIRPTDLRRKLKQATKKIEALPQHDDKLLIGEALLHAIVRHHFHSEPISCKIFYQSGNGLKGFKNAHIVHGEEADQLWLGKAFFADVEDLPEVSRIINRDLDKLLDTDFLKEEREVILVLREAQHLMPTTLEKAFRRNTSIDELLKSICIPVLLAYDSKVIKDGFVENYVANLIEELENHYNSVKPLIPVELKIIKIRIFLVPVLDTSDLVKEFLKKIN